MRQSITPWRLGGRSKIVWNDSLLIIIHCCIITTNIGAYSFCYDFPQGKYRNQQFIRIFKTFIFK